MNIKPLFDRVVLEQIENKNETAGGIFLPAEAQEKSQLGRILAVGDGINLDGKEVKMQVKVGDKVLYGKYSGSEITLENKKYIVLRQTDILAVIE